MGVGSLPELASLIAHHKRITDKSDAQCRMAAVSNNTDCGF
jgi:hypothetical protein